MSKPSHSSKSSKSTFGSSNISSSNNNISINSSFHHNSLLSNVPSSTSSSSSRNNHSLQYISIENPTTSNSSTNASFHSFHNHRHGATSPTLLNSTTTLPSLTSPMSKQMRSASPASFDQNQRPESPTYLPLGIGESISSSSSSASSSAARNNRIYSIGQRAPSVPADAFQNHHHRSQRFLIDSNAPSIVMTSGTPSSVRPPKSPMSSSSAITDTSSVVSSFSTSQSTYQPVSFDDETTLFVNIMKKDLGFIQKRINDLKYEEKHNSQRSDDIGNFSNCIYQNDQYRTRYSLLELFVDKLAEMQQILMHKTDKLIPVSKRFKTNTYEKKVSLRLQRFAEVSDRIMDVAENNKPSSLSSSPKKEKVQTSNKETQTKDLKKHSQTNKETQDAEVNTDRVDKTPYEAEIQELKKLVRYLQLDKEQAHKTIKDLNESVSSTHFEKQKEYDAIIFQLKKDIEKLKQEKMQILENQAATIESHRKADVLKIETQMKDKLSKIENLESRLYFKDKEIESIQDELDSLRSKSALQKEKDEAEAWKSKYQDVEKSRNEWERKYRDLVDECDLVKETLKKEELRYKETIETMREMQEHQNRLQSESTKQDTKKLQSKLEAAEKIAMQKEFQYEDLVKNYQIQSIELGITNKQNDNLKEQVKSLQREKQKLLENVAQEQTIDVKHEIELIKREYEDKSKNINEKMKDLQMGHVMQLKALNDTFTQERKMLQRKADKFKQRCDLLEARLEELEKNR